MSYTDFDFPHTSLYTSDLRELIANMRKLEEIVKIFVNENTIEFANPITWNITTQYRKGIVVLNEEGNGFISLKPVPVGIELNNEEYWLEIFNFTNYVRTANKNFTINYMANTDRSTMILTIGDWVVWNDVLYKVVQGIQIDDLLIPNTNIIHFTIEEFLKEFYNSVLATIQEYKYDIDESEYNYQRAMQAEVDRILAGATVDSEVIDARYGANDIEYTTLGNAIRTQFQIINTFFKNKLLAFSMPYTSFPPTLTANEYISVTTGQKANSNKYCRTGLWSGFGYMDTVSLDNPDYEMALVYYDSTGNVNTGEGYLGYIGYGNGWGNFKVLPREAIKVGFSFRRVDQENMTSSDRDAISAALSATIPTDKYLHTKGIAADALAVDQLKESKITPLTLEENMFEVGSRSSDDGHKTYPASPRIRTKSVISNAISGIKCEDGYEFAVYCWRNDVFLGTWTGSGFNHYVNWFTEVDFNDFPDPLNSYKIDLTVRKADESAITPADGSNVTATVIVDKALKQVIIPGSTNINIYPQLSASKRSDILTVAEAYLDEVSNMVYNGNATRNNYTSRNNTYRNGKLQIDCSLFTQLVWAGISPETFFDDPDNYNGNIIKAFNWGYYQQFDLRRKVGGLAIRNGGVVTDLYGYTSPDGTNEKGYSLNTHYSATGSLPHSQVFNSYMYAADIAAELCAGGYEIPISEANIGDILFYEQLPYSVNSFANVNFRRIYHVALIVAKYDGFFEVIEATNYDPDAALIRHSIFSEDPKLAAKAGGMISKMVMAARHPSAYGEPGNVPNKFVSVPMAET